MGAFCQSVWAQSTIPSSKEIQPFKPDSVYYLGEWVISSSVKVYLEGELLAEDLWELDEVSGLWRVSDEFRIKIIPNSTLRIEFESLPISLPRTIQPNTPRIIDLDELVENPDSVLQTNQEDDSRASNSSNLQQRGSLSRGIIVGTNQDFALESGLQFELSGQLTDDISINAYLTDRSIPIQPDGTTQNLREFDRVLIQLQSENTQVEMGDVDVSFEGSTFARLNRRLQGATGATTTKYGDYKAALSAVRGTFKSVSFDGEDGVQGPYRLTGLNNEEFVIILAGTERVYINGQEVNRGEENEYIIDYGLGEVYFTNNLLIKDETRIVIEYEFVDENFNRTLIAAEGKEELWDGRLKIGVSAIRQADGDELLSQETLTEEDIALLNGVGDDLSRAVISGVSTATEDDDINVRYAEMDTTFNGETFIIYRNIPGSEASNLVVRFSNVGAGQGSYQRVSGTVNGLLYEWVGPGNGDYEPFRQLPAPEEQQMLAMNTDLSITKNISLYGEWAISSFDQNRFSSLDDDDNNDFSYLAGINIQELNTGIGSIDASASRRFTGENFQFFERTRDVEFDRKWNINDFTQTEESINEASFSIQPLQNTHVNAEYGEVIRTGFESRRQGSGFQTNEEGVLNLRYDQDWVQTDDEILGEEGNWFRQRGSLGKEIGRFTPTMSFEQERREQILLESNELQSTSFSFYEVGPGIQYRGERLGLSAGVVFREEFRPLENELEKESTALEHRYGLNYRVSTNFDTQNDVSIRRKDFTNEFEELGNARRNGLLIRSVTNYGVEPLSWDGQIFYEANTERRALFQEAYIEVGPELGQYVWEDENGDGVEQIDEFFPELSPNEGTYVLQFLPSDELLPVIDLNVRLRNELTLFQFLRKEHGFSGYLSQIKVFSRINIQENSTTEELSDVYLIKLNTFRNDSTTTQGRLIWEKELDLFPEYNRGDVRVGYNQNRSLNQRTSETQTQYSELWFMNTSYQIRQGLRASVDVQNSISRTSSDQLTSRDFDIKSFTITPSIQSRISQSWETGFSASYSSKTDRLPANNVEATILKFSNTNRAYLFRKIQANSLIEIRNAEVLGNSSSLGNYELTDGTGTGTHLIWSLVGNYRVSNMVRISLNYDGRTVENRQDIHTIKLVVSAVF